MKEKKNTHHLLILPLKEDNNLIKKTLNSHGTRDLKLLRIDATKYLRNRSLCFHLNTGQIINLLQFWGNTVYFTPQKLTTLSQALKLWPNFSILSLLQ